MLLGDVWGYWYLTSQSGIFVDPDLKELRKPWADPIKMENIMYSGHLLHMVSLYSMLFDSDRYEENDALSFSWEPTFWGMGSEKFTYNLTSLQEAILKEMERENWLGVCCEPNSIFIVCNQFPMIGMRYNDARKGTDVAPTVLGKYQKAWNSTGMFQDDGLLIDWFSPKQSSKTYAQDPGFTAWTAAFLNAWNPVIANTAYKTAHKMVLQTMANYSHSAAANYPVKPSTAAKPVKPLPGYVAQMISEVGDEPALNQYLDFIDTTYNSTWEEGGLFYPASGQRTDDLRPMDSLSGNAGIPYARLNIFDGQRKMYEKPWTKEHFSTYPFIENVDLSSGVDFLRGTWNESLAAMAITMRTYSGTNKKVSLDISGLRQGRYRIYEDRKLLGVYNISAKTDIIQLEKNVKNEALDIIIQRA
ncbi:hypothetical protein NW762_006125 [Fusarium torreyae]|uniref:Linalool dehydratase/isomerase domain-containing protein n=1 Tax=Fusarium torreyae TaxID=1237075 RepID=A0A9W8RZU5_9HYPO|nr:hypothetical protein NW762_006125 [Fusarium torreyae]